MEVETTGGMEGAAVTPSAAPEQTPTPIEINEDSYVKLPGQEKPVKYGEYYKGFQSEFTRKAQEAARLQKEHEALRQRAAQYEDYIRRVEAARAGQQQGGQVQPGQNLLEKVKSLPYLDGNAAAEVVQDIMGQMGQFQNAIRQRDAVLMQMAQHMQKQNQMLNGIQSKTTSAEFDGKVNRWISDMGLPPEAKDLATEIYLAYEGDDLDQEFPQIFKQRWGQIVGIVRALDKKRVEQARQLPFTPKAGGQAGPSKPLNQGFKPAREIADELWSQMNQE